MADITTVITNQKVKDTVAEAAKVQEKALEEVKKLAESKNELFSGFTSVVNNAKNVISQSISGIVGNIKDSVSKFATTVNHGITSTLADLTKKKGSMIGDLQGKVNQGAVESKLSFLVNTTNNSIDGISLYGAGGTDTLLKDFTSGDVSKMLSATGMPNISTNAELSTAMSSVSGSLSSLTSGARSIMQDVVSMPRTLIGGVSSLVNESTNALIGGVSSTVSELAKSMGIDLNNDTSIISDMIDIYKMGKDTYNLVTGKDGMALAGITSRFNESFGEVESLVRLASDICSAMHGKFNLNDGLYNKDLIDLLMYRMANRGMYGAINDLMHCNETQGYVDERTFSLLANRLSATARKGDVYTTSSLQKLVGNGRIQDNSDMWYDLAMNMDTDTASVDEYLDLLQRTGVDKRSLTGTTYTGSNGGSLFVYDASRVAGLSDRSAYLASAVLGDSSVSGLSSGLTRLLAV